MSESRFFGRVDNRQERAGIALTELSHSTGRALPMHEHERAYFSFLLSGGYREETRTRRLEYRSGSFVFHPRDFAHSDTIESSGARFFIIEVDRTLVEDAANDIRDLPYLSADALRLYSRFRQGMLETVDFEDAAATFTALDAVAERRTPPPRWLSRALDQIRAEFRSPLTVAQLARDAGVHPVHFSRVFRGCFGMTVGDYLRRLRFSSAVSLLLDHHSISEAAHASGFADHAHFTRVCRELTGSAPSRVRELVATVA